MSADTKALLQLFSFPLVWVTEYGVVKQANSAAARLFGRDNTEAWANVNILNWDDQNELTEFFAKLKENSEMSGQRVDLLLDINTRVSCKLSGICCPNAYGEDDSYLLLLEPYELPATNSLALDLFEANPVSIWIVERFHYHFLAANEASRALLGMAANDIRKASLLQLLQEQDRDSFKTRLTCTANDKSQQGTLGVWRINCLRDGGPEPKWLELLVNPLYYGGRQALAMIVLDVTSRVQAEQETLTWFRDISYQRTELEQILDSMVDAVITINDQGIVEHCNPSTYALFGFSRSEMVGQNIKMLMPEQTAVEHDSYVQNYLQTGKAKIIGTGREVVAQHKDGHAINVRLTVSELPPGQDGTRRFLGCCHDLTQLKEQEKQLLLSQKLGAVGNLANGVAHDFNNILGIISGYAELTQMELGEQPGGQYQAKILSACERAAVLTRKLLDFSSSKPGQEQILSIATVLANMDEMLVEAVTRSVNLHYQIQEQLWPVKLDKGGLENVLLNLAINARQAMQEGGSIVLAARNLMMGNLEAQTFGLTAGEYVQISVIDNGIGMDEDTKLHVFEPFFTTKGKDGTGLGLAQVYSFVHRSGGGIGLESNVGQGTRFDLYFPRYQSDEPTTFQSQDTSNDALKPIYRRSATILLVDDEKELLSITRAVLESAGYKVLQANNVEDALRLLTMQRVDLVLTDVVMPGRGGIYLAEQVEKYYPDIEVQLITGFASEKSNPLLQENPYYQKRLIKPVSAAALLSRMDELLRPNTFHSA
ncbi:PAS domain S-box protein [Bowmanella sp. Y26]|uniref:hybrid sensor histidine kinase/response regulator n=1 Tax=Bowmanella yangjiangensis TaxID=2811230 RepID=UPI001BDC2BA6|nr:PAS domain-containing sensor histidine kinase [Bowmanella yangjiangensis]MBT1065310.1 PAS domain S-box protein [Bowmanella yangjiangensis]